MANKHIILYLPGREIQYSTADLGDSYITLVQFIEEVRSCAPQVVITDMEGGKKIYKGFPYNLDMWDDKTNS